MQEQGSWSWELKPLLDEYIYALRAAQATREGFAWLEALEDVADRDEVDWQVLREIASSMPTQWDRHTKRAAALADQLALTPRGRKAVGIGERDEEQPADPFAALDELAQRRKAG